MHRALLIQEVVHMVMQNILKDVDYATSKTQTLYNAALTCSSFLEPALDALWHHMRSLSPLFKLLSNFKPNFQDGRGILWGPILETDLNRFNEYASRVRSYRWQGVDDVDLSAFAHVLRASERSSIFPNLVDLQIFAEPEERFTPNFMFLVSPCLRDFFMFGSPTSPIAIVLNSLRITALNISYLTLFNMPFDDLCISAVCLLSRLQGISFEHNGRGLPTFDLSFFPHLSCKENLQNFALDGLLVIWSGGGLDCGTVEFPLLESIYFGLCFLNSIGPIAELFRYVTVPSLETLPIRLAPPPSKLVKAVESRYWHQFFDLVGKATTNRFKTLKIMLNNSYPDEEIRECWEHVGLTVFGFPNFDNLTLETFSILPPFLSSLGRNDLQKVIKSWPNLSRLELSSCRHSELDFTALVDIAVGLPRLEYLNIPLDIRGPLNIEGIPLLAHHLQEINLDTLIPLKDCKLWVQCIDRVFQYLKSCLFYHGVQLERQNVSSFFFMLQSARRDELSRVTLGITGV